MSSKTIDRKTEARSKRLLGAIVVRAGLSRVDRAFLLGVCWNWPNFRPEHPNTAGCAKLAKLPSGLKCQKKIQVQTREIAFDD